MHLDDEAIDYRVVNPFSDAIGIEFLKDAFAVHISLTYP